MPRSTSGSLVLLALVVLCFSCAAAKPPPNVQGVKILAFFGFSSQSHNNFYNALTTELAERGHDLTVVTSYPMKNPPSKNYKQIDAKVARELFSKFNTVQASTESVVERLGKWRESAEFFMMCTKVINMTEVKDLMKEKFDLVLVPMFMNECGYPFAWLNKAPLILLAPTGVASLYELGNGNPEPTSYVPNLFLPFTDHMTFAERLINTLVTHIVNFIRFYFHFPAVDAATKEIFGPDTPTVAELQKSASLQIINGHFSLNYPRPFIPAIIEAGGMQIKKNSSPLPKDLQEFLDGATDGAIFFSMGSILKAKDMPPEIVEAFTSAFNELPQRVIWKWEPEVLPGKPKNVKTGAWLPQQSILAHPNLKLFITHGGLLSTQEASYHGIPLVGIPMMGDQLLNVLRSENMGYALQLSYTNISKESILSTVKRVLNEPKFLAKAKELQTRVHDQPQTPLERAVFWTEYVLRHNGAPHLRSAAVDLEWYQLHLLDVYAFLIAFASIPLILTCCIIKKLCCSKGDRNSNPQNETVTKKKKKN
ncbi:Hypothetical predicted protein [Cloeon dipterum]|uniref:Glucuronosyltransferase n=1 Tax=Cloeon dipterum TaxID=197152 RepID=A0A8S1CUC2_9INSE|nr:Hypothetical predicted protein [Cloeon dipterum]